ncbi:MAG: hypothetical protein ABEH60_05990 [Halonotius sp.]|jgi:hypothetical protein
MSGTQSNPGTQQPAEPEHISSTCETCGSALVLYSTLTRETVEAAPDLSVANFEADSDGYDDEWVCPECLDGIRLDM